MKRSSSRAAAPWSPETPFGCGSRHTLQDVSQVRRALVIATVDPGTVTSLPDADLVIAADGGADVALAMDRSIDVLVGDLDSITDVALAAARRDGVRLVEHPLDKDETDLELALEVAVAASAHVHVVAGAAGRLDHAMVNLAVIASPRWASATVEATIGEHQVLVVHGERTIDGSVGDIVSLIPMGGPAHGVTTRGLRYELDAETLDPLAGRGVSNVIVTPPARVTVQEGVLVVIRPHGP